MYRCDVCAKVIPPGIRARRIVVETQPHSHPARTIRQRRRGRSRGKPMTDPGGVGPQIVREATACPACASDSADPRESRPNDGVAPDTP